MLLKWIRINEFRLEMKKLPHKKTRFRRFGPSAPEQMRAHQVMLISLSISIIFVDYKRLDREKA